MPIRVCILGQANPFAWYDHYVRAFRQRCEVLTIGPAPGATVLKSWGRGHLAHMIEPNDLETDLGALANLYGILPEGWLPHLVVSISGGGLPMFTNTASLGCPSAFLSIDTWQCLMEFNEAIHYDLVFAAQRTYVPYLRATGSRHVYWLPLACAPEAHFPVAEPKEFDISFVGAASMPVHQERARLLKLLGEHFSIVALERIHGDEMCRVMARGRLTFNHSAVEDLNMRIFEALAMGCPLLTNRASEPNGLLDLFEDGRDLVVYNSDQDLLLKAQRYLDDEPARLAIAQQGREEALARHTYGHRVDAILDTVRRHFPDFDSAAPTPRPRGDALSDYLPLNPGTVLDMGMELEVSKYALRRRGVDRLLGWSPEEPQRTQRARSYDETFDHTPSVPDGTMDTVVLSKAGPWGMDFAVRHAHRLLQEGGELVARFSAEEAAAEGLSDAPRSFSDWFHARDFHITHLHTCAGGSRIANARKRTRTLRDVVIETFTHLRVPNSDPHEIAAMVPPGL